MLGVFSQQRDIAAPNRNLAVASRGLPQWSSDEL